MSARGEALRLAKRAGMRPCQPGDEIRSPLGEPFYTEPRMQMPGCAAFMYTLNGSPVGVLIIRRGERTKLRYCDREGRPHEELMAGDTLYLQQTAGALRMSELISSFLGERHPLADRAAANVRPI